MVGMQFCFIPCMFRLYQDVGHFYPSCHQKVARFGCSAENSSIKDEGLTILSGEREG